MSEASPVPTTAKRPADAMKKLVALCKSRGFVFQSSEIYGGLKSAYDYGPLGAELKRNLMGEWWRDMVTTRENVVGIDASIIMHPEVWRASGHAAGFSDPLVDCKVSKERFRADKAPRPAPGDELPISCPDKGVAKDWSESIVKQFGVELSGTATSCADCAPSPRRNSPSSRAAPRPRPRAGPGAAMSGRCSARPSSARSASST